MIPVIATNILIDYLNGEPRARDELERYDEAGISLVSWMEILVGSRNADEEQVLRTFLLQFQLIAVDAAVAEQAILLRRSWRLRLPDATIWAAAKTKNTVLVTRNTRDFDADQPDIRVPYAL